ncbi:SNF2 super family, partial [Micromonas pusilla CCMP1545]
MRLKGRAGGPKFELAGELAARLYDHQRDGVRWMWNLQLNNRGGILADDMGLGKTLQVAAFAAGLLRSKAAKRVLVLAPTTLLPHWGKEFIVAGLKEGVNLHRFAGGGSKTDRDKALSKVLTHGGVLLTTYGMVTHNATGRGSIVAGQDLPDGGTGLSWDWVVCDEGHKLKNPNAQLPRKIRTIPASYRLIITGTPIQNHLAELWALYDLCCPGLLGDEVEFRREYSKKIGLGQSRDATQRQREAGARASDELRTKCRPFMLRREKSSVLAKAAADEAGTTSGEESNETAAAAAHAPSQLGSKNDLIVWLPLRPAQRRLYQQFLKSGPVRAALNKTGSALSAINVLKKICDHPALCCAITGASAADAAASSTFTRSPSKSPGGSKSADLGGDPSASGKAAFLMDMLRHLASNGHRTLVFSQSRAMLDVLEKAAAAEGHKLVRIDGNVPADERHARVERFQSDASIPLALLTSQVGGLGLTLTAADRVVIYDPSWNPASDSQSVDRAYRIG